MRYAATIERYLDRHAVAPPPWIELAAPNEELRICVVIPAYDELTTIESVIRSLHVDELPDDAVELLVCVNNPEDAPKRVLEANRATIDRLRGLDSSFPIHVLDRSTTGRAFPPERAGVGHARRLLMDLATRRLYETGRSEDGLIACLDGDSPADPGYLDAIWREFAAAPPTALAGVCNYRHPIPDDPEHARAIISYEAWMRYFEAALKFTDTPYAFQSIGSCMVLTAAGYARADGVPPKEALSDFYLLQKVAKTGGRGAVMELRQPLVRPSARPSTRVPRGTGPSVRASMHHGEERFVFVEPPSAFFDLRRFFSAIRPAFAQPQTLQSAASPFLSEILSRWNGWKTIDKLRAHAPDPQRFERQFHTWFDSLKIVKYANRSREHRGAVFLFDALRELLTQTGALDVAAQIPDVSPKQARIDDWRRLLDVLRAHHFAQRTGR